jgi:hypothetical protein
MDFLTSRSHILLEKYYFTQHKNLKQERYISESFQILPAGNSQTTVMKKLLPILILTFTTSFFSCKKENTNGQINGILKKQGATYYQYGTHTLTTDSTTYALKSDVVNLDKYLNRKVAITGEKVKGYPLEGGPDLIEVKTIR